MTSSEAEPTTVTADEGIQQIPAQITVPQPAAVTGARDKLLAAIGAEAQHVAEKSAGQASAALAELARAYTLVAATSPSPELPADGATAQLGSLVVAQARSMEASLNRLDEQVTYDPNHLLDSLIDKLHLKNEAALGK
ncbi:hypothetical protein ACFWBF_34390 [Streptomyces sp. NPDC060028]|uniref:hypothetical protein n=1 Tax=Streptomyces sp. NPDC060028 TaxID=3347041 RepID=UPI003693EBF0